MINHAIDQFIQRQRWLVSPHAPAGATRQDQSGRSMLRSHDVFWPVTV